MVTLSGEEIQAEMCRQHAQQLRRAHSEVLESLEFLIREGWSVDLTGTTYGAVGGIDRIRKWKEKEIKIYKQTFTIL